MITIIITVTVLVIILLLTLPDRQSEPGSLPSPFVHAGNVEQMDVQALNIIIDKLQPERKAHLRFEVAGRIIARHVEPGQTKFLAPMTVSPGFGLEFATVLILIARPCFYLIANDLRSWCLMELNWRRVAVQ
jgi:hypothetical protein